MLVYSLLLYLSLCARFCHSFISTPTRGAQQLPRHRHLPGVLLATIQNEDVNNEKWEWDGTVQEGAHDDEFDSIDDAEEFVPSIGFMSAAAMLADSSGSVVGGVAAAAQTATIFDPSLNSGTIHRLSVMEDDDENMSEDDLLEMGGDPDFLGDDNDGRFVDASTFKEIDDSDIFEWDGMVDEDAHLDM
ncbi:hypothetical protein ACHAXH_003862 [Discostella pseudostelligera]